MFDIEFISAEPELQDEGLAGPLGGGSPSATFASGFIAPLSILGSKKTTNA